MISIQAAQIIGITVQPLRFFLKAETDRGVPFDIGPPVHVIADPGSEPERDGAEP